MLSRTENLRFQYLCPIMKTYSLESNLHEELEHQTEYCHDWDNFTTDECQIFVRSGGTEGMFLSVFQKPDGSLNLPGSAPLRLLTNGESNSLAASMEILSFLRQNGYEGVIVHSDTPSGPGIVREFKHKGILKGRKYGVVGVPSDWLISSKVNYSKAEEVLGCQLVDIPMSELLKRIEKGPYTMPEGLKPMFETDMHDFKPKFGRPITTRSFQTAIDVYGALKSIISDYALDGLTIRCFDLLSTIHNTGCLALARLNADGYIATCEGDIPAMLTMAIARELYGKNGFQVNLSKVEDDMLLFAHCTISMDMVEDYSYDTHFESGIGVALHGILPEGRKAHILKLSADLESFVDEEVTLVKNQYENKLCRTQIWVRQSSALGNYMLTSPLGNHHVLVW